MCGAVCERDVECVGAAVCDSDTETDPVSVRVFVADRLCVADRVHVRDSDLDRVGEIVFAAVPVRERDGAPDALTVTDDVAARDCVAAGVVVGSFVAFAVGVPVFLVAAVLEGATLPTGVPPEDHVRDGKGPRVGEGSPLCRGV